MAMNSEMHQTYLEMPIDAQMMPQLEQMQYWSRTVHEIMFSMNPAMMISLANKNELKSYLDSQQDKMSEEARALEKAWKMKNPLPKTAAHHDRVIWNKHAQLSAREQLIQELSQSLSALAQESNELVQ